MERSADRSPRSARLGRGSGLGRGAMLGRGDVLLGLLVAGLATAALVVWSEPVRAGLSDPLPRSVGPERHETATTMLSLLGSSATGVEAAPCGDRLARLVHEILGLEPVVDGIRGSRQGCVGTFVGGLTVSVQEGHNGADGRADAMARYRALHPRAREIGGVPEGVMLDREAGQASVVFFTESNWYRVPLPSGTDVRPSMIRAMYASS